MRQGKVRWYNGKKCFGFIIPDAPNADGNTDDVFVHSSSLKAAGIRFLNENDIVVGLAASGRTPYVKGALDYANEIGAQTVSVCCVTNGEISSHATYPIEVICGPESITGSTRMKAGTAQKMVLNMFSSVLMVKAGKVYENLMVDVRPTNEKLVARAKRIIAACTNTSEEVAGNALEKSNGDVKVAIITILGDCDVQRAKEILEEHHGHVASAIEALK